MLEIGVIGRGAIGGPIIRALAENRLPGARLAGVLARPPCGPGETERLADLLARRPGLVIEAAGQEPARRMAGEILASGADLLLFSVGALADPGVEAACAEAVRAPGSGRLYLSSGAVGGLDMLKAMRATGTLERVSLRSTTRAAALVQPWMEQAEADRLRHASAPLTVFEGTAREAARRFPASANVSAAIALASLGLDAVRVALVGDPATPVKRHEIEAASADCTLRFEVANLISADNPRTSRITPYAALRFIADRTEAMIAGG